MGGPFWVRSDVSSIVWATPSATRTARRRTADQTRIAIMLVTPAAVSAICAKMLASYVVRVSKWGGSLNVPPHRRPAKGAQLPHVLRSVAEPPRSNASPSMCAELVAGRAARRDGPSFP